MSELKTNKPFCSPEQAINATNWDKHSTWEALSNKTNIEPWPADQARLDSIKAD